MWRGRREKRSKHKVALFLSIEGLPRKQNKTKKDSDQRGGLAQETHTLRTARVCVCADEFLAQYVAGFAEYLHSGIKV